MTNDQSNETSRIKALQSYGVLDTIPESVFDDIALLASQICDTPIALVSFVDSQRQWFKAKVGIDATETHRNLAFCHHTIQQDDVFVINEANQHPDFKDNGLVTGGPQIRFYAGAVLKNADGEALGSLCVIDQKPRMLSEKQTNALRALSRQVMQLLEFRRLQQADAKATILKSEFIARMSHEIRVPLNAIQGYVNLALDEDNLSVKHSHLSVVQRNLKSLNHLVDEVLDLSKIEAGLMEIKNDWFSIKALIRDTHELFVPLARAKGLGFEITVCDAIADEVFSDESKHRQILRNLISNALKFTQTGHVAIHLNQIDSNAESCLIQVLVSDTGRGVSQEKIDRLFKAYSQIEGDQRSKDEGTGLGLNVSAQLAELLGGRLELESSEIDKGSKFAFTILVPSRSVEQVVPQVKTTVVTGAQPLKGRVLFADDTADNRMLVKHMLKASDIELVYAENGQEALDLSLESAFDLILMDIEMPVMDGLSATKAMRKAGIRTPILALTAHALDVMRDKIGDAGFSGTLTKPISKAGLLNILGQHLSD
ncbi:MAG: hybrid sensor histidine kinase/response regulator [Proteobacteria bacterium]|nr:MAG: hybrid sensor histidine kinase/response regulator [Pseudomonadota bacterium]